MSTGVRMPLELAEAAAGYLRGCWGLTHADVTVVGSVRRRRPQVGDVELCVPIEPAADDGLYRVLIDSANTEAGLFGGDPDVPPISVQAGLRPGFKAARLVVHIKHNGADLPLPVEVYRFAPEGRAWSLIMRTGPSPFGIYFLRRWKAAHGMRGSQVASMNGLLVDHAGEVVPVTDEREAFERAQIRWVEPEARDEFAAFLERTKS